MNPHLTQSWTGALPTKPGKLSQSNFKKQASAATCMEREAGVKRIFPGEYKANILLISNKHLHSHCQLYTKLGQYLTVHKQNV